MPSRERPVELPRWDASDVEAATDARLAVDDDGRLLAASPAAVTLLGPQPTGRALAELLPPQLRETLVAGLTRYRTTGVGWPDGQVLTLQLLDAEGRERRVSVGVDRHQAGGGRTVFVAVVTPVD
ncbi:PAS domain S-box protein [Angustibacter aerolatus]